MIFRRIVGVHKVSTPWTCVAINRFNNCFAFSDFKKKAEKYLCAAVAYRTLADVDPDEIYTIQSPLTQTNNMTTESQVTKKF
jgi:hypothetical protein